MENWWEHEEEQTFDTEKQAELEQFEARQKKQYRTGKILVYLLAGMHILFRIVSWLFSGDFKPVGFAVTLLMAAGLIYGVSWVRYLYIVGDVISILLVIVAIPSLVSLESLPLAPVLILLVMVLYMIVDLVLMIASKSIKEYMYQRKNG